MTAGRKPKLPKSKRPDYLSVVQGEAEAAPTTVEPDAAVEIEVMPCPDYFDDTARDVWVFLHEHLQRQGLYAKLDVFKLEIFCAAVSDFRHYREALAGMDDRGVYRTSGRNGFQRKNDPRYTRMLQAAATINAVGSDFGLDPVSRHRLKVIAAGGGDDQGELDLS